MFRWLKRRWRQRQRDLDHDVLFGAIKSMATDQDHFLRCVRFHMVNDDAWNVDYDELSERDRLLWDEVFGGSHGA